MKNLIITIIALILAGLLLDVRAGTVGDPFTGGPIQINATPGSVTQWEAENFDKGGEGVAYHDLSRGNCAQSFQAGWCMAAYRLTEDVDIQAEPDGNYNILNAEAGEYLNYTIEVGAVGMYTVELMIAIGSSTTAPAYHVELDGATVTKSTGVGASTGSFHIFQWRGLTETFPMVPGRHVLRIVIDVPYFNIDAIRVKYAAGIEWQVQQVPVWKVYP